MAEYWRYGEKRTMLRMTGFRVHKNAYSLLLSVCLGILLSACSTVPREVENAPESSPSIVAVQNDPMPYAGQTVRWGGSIVKTENQDGETIIQIVSRPLSSNTRPTESDQTDGRFIAKFDGFLDPEIYKTDRMLTVVGEIDGLQLSKIGDSEYTFPVVKVDSHYLWEEIVEPDHPYGYYDPWYPWPHPYYRYYYRGFYSPYWLFHPVRPHWH